MLRAVSHLSRSRRSSATIAQLATMPFQHTTPVAVHTNGRSRSYHTYPEAGDKGVETNFKASDSDVTKQILDKSGEGFSLHESYGIDKVFPGVPSGVKVDDDGAGPQTKHTILPSGLTVASQDMPGLMASFSFMVGTGSSYEKQNSGSNGKTNTGVTQMLEMAAFKTTANRLQGSLPTDMERLGGMMQCISSRENILYCVDVLRENLEPALDILAESVRVCVCVCVCV
jgi:mitochondrial-processing peptidase subunit alpha